MLRVVDGQVAIAGSIDVREFGVAESAPSGRGQNRLDDLVIIQAGQRINEGFVVQGASLLFMGQVCPVCQQPFRGRVWYVRQLVTPPPVPWSWAEPGATIETRDHQTCSPECARALSSWIGLRAEAATGRLLFSDQRAGPTETQVEAAYGRLLELRWEIEQLEDDGRPS